MNGLQRLCRRAMCAPIRFYQRWLSAPLGRSKCRYVPTCSQYACEAILTHGCVKGLLLALWRLARCNPLGPWGIDPVPEVGQWVSQKRVLYPAGSGKRLQKKAPDAPKEQGPGPV